MRKKLGELARELEDARAKLDRDLTRAGEKFEGLPDASIVLTEKSKLRLREHRLYIERKGLLYPLTHPEVPTRIKVKASHNLQALYALAMERLP